MFCRITMFWFLLLIYRMHIIGLSKQHAHLYHNLSWLRNPKRLQQTMQIFLLMPPCILNSLVSWTTLQAHCLQLTLSRHKMRMTRPQWVITRPTSHPKHIAATEIIYSSNLITTPFFDIKNGVTRRRVPLFRVLFFAFCYARLLIKPFFNKNNIESFTIKSILILATCMFNRKKQAQRYTLLDIVIQPYKVWLITYLFVIILLVDFLNTLYMYSKALLYMYALAQW